MSFNEIDEEIGNATIRDCHKVDIEGNYLAVN